MFEVKYDKDGNVISNQPIVEETQTPQETSVVEPVQAQSVQEHNQEPIEQQEKAQVKNFRALKDQKEQIERERDEALRFIKDMQKKFMPETPTADAQDDQLYVNPDDIVEGKHLTKVQKQIKQMNEKLAQYEKQAEAISIENRIKSQYPDFDKVVNETTLQELRTQDPEFAESLYYNPNLYSKAVGAYKAIKKFGIYNGDAFNKERELAQKNAAKPRPLTSVSPQQGDSPLSHANAFANGLTEDLKVQLRKEMEEARKKY